MPTQTIKKKANPDVTYDVTFHGEYTAVEGSNFTLKPYEIDVVIDQAMLNQYGSLTSAFCKLYGKAENPQSEMKKKYPDFSRLHTFHIKNAPECSDPSRLKNDISMMVRPQLEAYIDDNSLEVDADLYTDDEQLKQAIKDCEDDEAAFLKQQEKRRELHGADVDMQKRAKQLMQKKESLEAGRLTNIVETDQSEKPSASKAQAVKMQPLKPQSKKINEETDLGV